MIRNVILSLMLILPFLAAGQQSDGYFQQRVNYQIDVVLDDENHELNGNIAIEYINNSPDELPFIWMHLWPNAYSGANTALAKQQFREGKMLLFYAMDKQKGGIDSLNFTVNNEAVKWEYHPEHPDVAKIMLNEPLRSGGVVVIRTPFRVDLPSGSISRLGHVGQSYQITQWYPKPAVYDQDGWHEMPYLNMGEFYSEFGSFDVSITVPSNYVVGATGDLLGCPLEEAFLDSLAEATAANLDSLDGSMDFPPSSSRMKTLRYTQDNVHDFAWFADKRWHVLKGEVELPGNKRKVTTWAMFTPRNARYWKRAIEYLNDGTYYYSLWNGDYPYKHVTAVDGTISAGGGMEYPNITVIGNVSNDLSLETVIVHEVGHNWFYGILGSNERTNAWMDEGINSFNETRYFTTKYDSLELLEGMLPDDLRSLIGLKGKPYEDFDELTYLISARLHLDQPMQCHSADYLPINYGTIVYKKTAAAFEYLKAYLGEERFDNAMQAYFREWKFKHPGPKNLRKVLERETGEDLSWFFKDLVQTANHVDYAIRSVKKKDGVYQVRLENEGDIPGPVHVVGYREGEAVTSQWVKGVRQFESVFSNFNTEDIDAFQIDPKRNMLEYDRKNNFSKTKGLFKKLEPLRIRPVSGFEDQAFTQLFATPVAAWNNQDRWMLGMNIHNTTLPPRDHEFSLTPMYSFASGRLTGFGRASAYRGPMEVHLTTQSFRYDDSGKNELDYWRNELEVWHHFNKVPTSPWESSLWFDFVHLRFWNNAIPAALSAQDPVIIGPQNREQFIPSVGYLAERSGIFVDHAFSVGARYALDNVDSEAALIYARYDGKWRYDRKDHAVNWRVFAGGSDELGLLNFPLTGYGVGPSTDVFVDHLMLSRGFDPQFSGLETANNSFLQRQMTDTYGSIRAPFIAQSWMTSALVEWELPIGLPISVFAGAAVYDQQSLNLSDPNAPFLENTTEFSYSAGVSVPVLADVIEVQIPLLNERLYTGDPNDFTIPELIMFEFHIDRLNPWRLMRDIEF